MVDKIFIFYSENEHRGQVMTFKREAEGPRKIENMMEIKKMITEERAIKR